MIREQRDSMPSAAVTQDRLRRGGATVATLAKTRRLLGLPDLPELSYPSTTTLARAILAGFMASIALLVVFSVAYAASLVLASALPTDRPVVGTLGGWFRGLTHNPVLDLALPNPFEAVALFAAGGVVWALLYASVFEPRLHGPDWQRGLIFALVPWAFSLAVFLPLVGGGVFGLGLGAGPLPIVGNLALHAVYGVVLGLLYGPFGEMLDNEGRDPSEAERAALACCESGAVRGLAVGLLLGALLGGAVLMGSRAQGAALILGVNPLGVLLATILAGGSAGAAAGAFVASPEH